MRLQSCAVAKLFLSLQQLQRRKSLFMSINNATPLRGIGVYWLHNRTTMQSSDYRTRQLCDQAVAQRDISTSAQSYIFAFLQLHNRTFAHRHNQTSAQLHNSTTAEFNNHIPLHICNRTILCFCSYTAAEILNRKITQPHNYTIYI